jgi:hypothetical protein
VTAMSYDEARQPGDKPESYTPHGAALEDLNLASGMGAITMAAAFISAIVAWGVNLHPLSGFWGFGFGLSALIGGLAAVKRDSYPSKNAMYRSSMASMLGACGSFVMTIAVWLLLIFAPLN